MTLLILSFIAGALTVLAPCILPLLPIIVGGAVSGGANKQKALVVIGSLGASVVLFTLLLKASTLFLTVPEYTWKLLSGGILVVFGIVTLFPELWARNPITRYMNTRSNKLLAAGFQKKSVWGDIIIGAALGPVFSTCSPTYFIVLATVLPVSPVVGIVYLLAYAAGLCLMLLSIALLGQRLTKRLGFVADTHGWLRKAIAIIFVVVGAAILFGVDKKIEAGLLNAGIFDVTKIEQQLLEFNKPTMSTEREKRTLAPEISTPDGFVNTNGQPLTLESLRGKKVVLLDIWTYSCINCQRTIPYLNDWYDKYRDEGLEIIGLHTPEFAFEQVQANVEKAVKQFGIEYPVVLDNDFSTWNALGNQYWPRKYLIDLDGAIIYDHIGEGGYAETEQEIQNALKDRMMRLGKMDSIDEPITASDQPTTTNRVKSPEVYFGALRNATLANGKPGTVGTQTLQAPQTLNPNQLYLSGSWSIQEEYAQNNAPARIHYAYSAKDVYMVAQANQPIKLTILRDGVVFNELTIESATLYTLIAGEDYGDHVMEIIIDSPGLEAFTFTFG